jgi:hypothetical protein
VNRGLKHPKEHITIHRESPAVAESCKDGGEEEDTNESGDDTD